MKSYLSARLAAGAALFLLCLTLGWASPSPGAQASFSIKVPAGRWNTMRLRNIPQNASLRVTIEVSGDTGIALVDSKGYEKYPAVDRPLSQAGRGRKSPFR